MLHPEVSIIVPVYNAEKYINRCINSLTNQTLNNIEIILVDDSSTDSSLDICMKEAEKDSRIRVIHKENEGAGMARNVALKVANGEYIGFVDSDDYIEEHMYKTLCDKAKESGAELVMSGVIFVGGNMFSEDGGCVSKSYFSKDTFFTSEKELKELRLGIIGALPDEPDDSKYGMSIWKNLFRRDVITKNNILFESERKILSEDALFMIDYISCIKKAAGINGAFYNYCRNGDSISKSFKKDRFEKSLAFVNEVENRLKKDISREEYLVYINRFWQAMCRVLCSQEIIHATDEGIGYNVLKSRLNNICSHKLSARAFKNYPLSKLPLKQRIFAYCMKYRLYFLLKLLVHLRNG